MVLLERGLAPMVDRMLDATKVVILEGGRAVGKTTLARQIAKKRAFGTTFDLADPGDRDILSNDPYRVLITSKKPILIDEAQLEPELTVAVKRLVDASQENGQVLLTGSTRIGRGALGGTDPLAGRAIRLRLHALTQGELRGQPSQMLDRWWSRDFESGVFDDLSLDELFGMFMVGGLPAVAVPLGGANLVNARRVIGSYIAGVVTENLAGTRVSHSGLTRTFRYLAANPGQILNVQRAASELSVRAETIRAHLVLCEASFLLDVASAHRPTEHQTVTAHPRIFASDVALAAWAADTSVDRLVRDSKLSGALLENLVANELTAQSEWQLEPTRLLHWRDSRAGREVDLVLRRHDGSTIAVEVKSSSRVSLADTKGLQAFADVSGAHHLAGVIVYTGRVTQQLAEKIWAVPLQSFWS